MSDRMKRTLVIETEVDRKTLNSSEQVVKNFFDKYQDKKMKVSTPDFQEILNPIRDIEKEIDRVAEKMPHMLGSISVDKKFLADVKDAFKEVEVRFTDGSMAKGFDAIMEKTKSFALQSVDLGEFLSSVQEKARSAVDTLKEIGALTISNNGGKYLEFDKLNIEELKQAFVLMQELLNTQKELDSFNGTPLKQEAFYSDHSTRTLSNMLNDLTKELELIKELGLNYEQLIQRRKLINKVDANEYGSLSREGIDQAKIDATQDIEEYQYKLSIIKNHIAETEKLMSTLQNSSNLFTPKELSTNMEVLTNNLNEAKSQLQELQQIGKVSDTPIGGNFNEVVDVLNQIKNTLQEISTVFSNTESSMRGMAESSKTSFEGLSKTIADVYNNLTQIQTLVDTISKKDFNITNITQTGGGDGGIQAMRQQVAQAMEQFEHLRQLYDQAGDTLQGLASKGQMPQVIEYSKQLQDLDLNAIRKSIKGANSEIKLASAIAEVEDYIKKLTQLNELRNKFDLGGWKDTFVPTKQPIIQPTTPSKPQEAVIPTITQPQNTIATTNAEAQHMYQLKAAIDEVSNAIGRKNAGFKKEAEIVDTSVTAEEKKLRELIGVITTEIGNALDGIKEKFTQSFAVPEINKSGLQTSIDDIYNKFVELQKNVQALKINIGVETAVAPVVDSASNTQQAVDGETQSAVDAAQSFVDAANAKKQFVEANKQVAESAKASEDAVKKEGEAAKSVATDVSNVASKVSKNLAKTKDIFNNDGELIQTDETLKFKTDKAIVSETESTRITRDGDGNEVHTTITTIVKDFEKLSKEADKSKEAVARAQNKLNEFLTRFQSKSGGNAKFISGFSELKNTTVTSDNIEETFNKMMALQAEYSKLETNFRKGQSSLNPFVNAITKSENIGNIFGDVERQFNALTNKSDELVKNFTRLQDLSLKIKDFTRLMNTAPNTITPEKFSDFSKQVGEFNVLKSQVEGSIKAEQKIETDNEKQRIKEVTQYIDLVKQMNEYELKATKGGSMQPVYEAKVAKLKEEIIASDKLSIMNQEEKNKLLAIEEAHQLKIAEIQQKDVDKQLFKTQNDKLQGKFDAGYLSDSNFSNWKNQLAQYQSYLDGTVKADDATIQRKKTSLSQLYDHLNKISNASRTFFSSGGEILPTWFNPDQIQNVSGSLHSLYNNIVTERFNGMKTSVTGVNETLGRLTFTVDDGKGALTQYTIAMDRASGATKLLMGNTKGTMTNVQQFSKALKGDVISLSRAFIGGMSGMYAVGRYIRQGIQAVRELDKALTELRKVTDETEETYDKFLDTAGKTGARIGRTITDVVSATSEFAKLGYEINTAASMAESALIYANVGDNVDVETGSQSIISTMKAFGVEANNTMSIVDKFNEIGNNFAITTKGIGDALQVSASAMAAAGNSLDETIALTTAAM